MKEEYSMNLCKYKNALGEPNKGVHSYRFLGVAIFDVVATIVGAFFISRALNQRFDYVLIILFVLGIFLHYLFCVETTIGKLLFGENKVQDG